MTRNRVIVLPIEFERALREYCRKMECNPSTVLRDLLAAGLEHSVWAGDLRKQASGLRRRAPKGRPKFNQYDPEFMELAWKVQGRRAAGESIPMISNELQIPIWKIKRLIRRIKECN